MSLIRAPKDSATLETFCAVTAFAEQTGGIVVAEGIETEEHLENARALGATHAQGWLFGRPSSLPSRGTWELVEVFDALPRVLTDISLTPLDWLAVNAAPGGRTGRSGVLALWGHLLDRALDLGTSAVCLTIPGPALTTRDLYAMQDLAEALAFVATLEVGPHTPAPGVRTATLTAEEALAHETCICVLAPHFSVAFAARPVDGQPDLFDFHITHDRTIAACAARRLMVRVDSAS